MCLAIPGQIIEIAPGGHLATVEVSRVRRTINIDLLDDAPPAPGDWVLIHVGFAMSRISAEHAAEQLRLLAMLGEDAQAMAELDGYTFAEPAATSVEGERASASEPREPPPPQGGHGGRRRNGARTEQSELRRASGAERAWRGAGVPAIQEKHPRD